jgi:hypothetical protein
VLTEVPGEGAPFINGDCPVADFHHASIGDGVRAAVMELRVRVLDQSGKAQQ